jgi:hypothetical protein
MNLRIGRDFLTVRSRAAVEVLGGEHGGPSPLRFEHPRAFRCPLNRQLTVEIAVIFLISHEGL